MAFQAQRAHIGQIAFAPAFGYGPDVIGVPESLAAAEPPFEAGPGARRPAKALDVAELRQAVETADGADAAITL